MDKLRVFEMVIDETVTSDVEVSRIAFVDKPAIEKNFMTFKDFDYENFGGPGSGPQGGDGGGGGDDDSGDPGISKILDKPRHERSESDIKKLLKRKKKTEVKDIADNGKSWLKKNTDKVGSVEHRTVSREVNVADRILRGFYESLHFAVNPEQRIVSGPAMIADQLIYRRDDNGEYNVFFSAETIKQIALKFFKKDYQKNLNLFHDPTLSLEGVTIFESFVSDESRGIQPMKGFEELPDGTWFISAKIENEQVWQKIKSGEVKGFSVEGIFSYVKKPVENQLSEIVNATLGQNVHLDEKTAMSLKDNLKKFKESFMGKKPQEFELKDKTKVTVTELVVGGKITIGDKPVPEGKLEFLDGSTANVGNDGNITSVAPPPAQTLAKDYTLKDGVTMVNISDMAVGGVVMLGGVPAPAGEYELSDGTKCTVGEGGLITAITPAMTPNLMTEQRVTDIVQKALQAHQAAMDAQKLAADNLLAQQKMTIENQDKKIAGLFELVEELAKTAPDPIGDTKLTFSQERIKSREEKLKQLSENIAKLKKVS